MEYYLWWQMVLLTSQETVPQFILVMILINLFISLICTADARF